MLAYGNQQCQICQRMTNAKRGRYTPLNPVALSTNTKAPAQSPHGSDFFGGGISVSAVTGDNSDLMFQVAKLWILDSDVVADVTFGKGVFWRKLRAPNHGHDIQIDGVDCRRLPHGDNSIDVLVLDPPYRPNHGSPLPTDNGLSKAYGLGNQELESMNDVLNLYSDALAEAERVVKVGGRAIVKCQDMTYGHRLHLVTLDVLRLMVEHGFEFADQFVLVQTNQLCSSIWEKQERARRTHSILWVGIKS